MKETLTDLFLILIAVPLFVIILILAICEYMAIRRSLEEVLECRQQ